MYTKKSISFITFLLHITCIVIACLCIIPKSTCEKKQYFSLEHPKITFAHPLHFCNVVLKSRRRSRSNPIHYVDLNGTNLKTLDNHYKVVASFYQLLSNKYKPSFVELSMPLCDALKNDFLIAPAFIDGFNRMPLESRPMPELKCPIVPGNYTFTNMIIPIARIPARFPFLEGRIYGNMTRDILDKMILMKEYTKIPFQLCLKTLSYPITKYSTDSSAETVDLAYSSYENTSEENSTSPPVVILHGLLGSKNNWNSMSKAIHKTTGRKVISIDARNHGDSKHSPQHSYLHMAHDVMKLLKSLEISKVSLLGHSMGGRTAMVLSLLCSDLVSSLITVDISPVKTSPQIFSMVSLFDAMTSVSIRSGIAMSKARKLADEQLKGITPDVNLRNFLLTNLVQTNTGSYTWRVNIPALKENFQHNISCFPTSLKGLQYCGPTLFIGGALSDYIGKSDLPLIQEYFPLADLKFIEGAGHWVHSQKPEKFLEVVCSFLQHK